MQLLDLFSPLNWSQPFSFSPYFRLPDRIKPNLDTALSFSGRTMYGLIFENFSGYIKVSGMAYSVFTTKTLLFSIILILIM